ncbi:hypothetical protein ASE63_05835 [Bosea sp. Root381]|nr:hypothetical protein ASE63_05835 [Bosea sp. Root381]
MSAGISIIRADVPVRAEGGLPRTVVRLMRLVVLAALAAVLLIPAFKVAANDPPAYRVAPGDRLGIVVFGQTELSGEWIVDGTHSVTMPLIGAVPVRGLGIREIEQSIAQRLAQGFVQKPIVSVRLAEARPIYVVGDVKTPGSHPYRYGISVMAAVALSGGFTLTEERAQAVLRAEYLQADERVRTLEGTRNAILARRIRLEAQRDNRSSLDFAGLPAPTTAGGALADIIKGEAEMHAFQNAALAEQVALVEQQRPKLEAGKRYVSEQLASEKRQLELIQQHLVDYNALLSSGLARRYTGIELQREEARNRGNIARFNGEMSNIEVSLGELAIRVRDIRDIYQRRVKTELQETLMRLGEIEAALPAARGTRELRLRQVGFVEEAGGAPRRALFVSRAAGDKSETFAVTDTTLLEPGDILRVERLPEPPLSAEPVAVNWR